MLYGNCEECPFSNTSCVSGFGKKNADFIIVGEGPGLGEVKQGAPFVGQAGQLLNKLLSHHQLERKNAYVTNATLCYPGRGKKDKALPFAVEACKARLMQELEGVNPLAPVLLLGAAARQAFGVETSYLWQQAAGRLVLPVLHPAAALYNETQLFEIVMGIRKFALGVNGVFPSAPAPPEPFVYVDSLPSSPHTWDYGWISIDLETSNLRWYGEDADEIMWMGIAGCSGIPAVDGTQVIILSGELIRNNPQWVRQLFDAFKGRIGGHNIKYDLNFLRHHLGLEDLEAGWDTILMVRDYQEHWQKSLKFLATYFYDVDDYAERLINSHFKNKDEAKRDYRTVPEDDMLTYLAHDVHYTLLLAYDLQNMLQASKRYYRPYNNYNIPLLNELVWMEQRGVAVDIEGIRSAKVEFEQLVVDTQARIKEFTSSVVSNPNSFQQVAKYMYEVLKIPPPQLYKKPMHTTCNEALEEILSNTLSDRTRTFIEDLREFRRIKKMLSSYINPLQDFARKGVDGVWRVHPSYKQAFVTTGRLSAVDPAIQTAPRGGDDSDLGRHKQRIRRVFIPSYDDWVLVAVDGSQWELRVAAAWSEDPKMVDIYQSGIDFHGAVCDTLFGVDQWSPEERTLEKNFIFSWMYGGSVWSSASVFQVPIETKKILVEQFNTDFARLVEWREDMFETARRDGVIVTPMGRAMHFPLITDHNYKDVKKFTVNYPVQGTASDLVCEAGFLAGPILREMGAYPIIFKHDEIVAECPAAIAEDVASVLVNYIEQTAHRVFPIIPWVAEAQVGRNWKDMVPLEVRREEK